MLCSAQVSGDGGLGSAARPASQSESTAPGQSYPQREIGEEDPWAALATKAGRIVLCSAQVVMSRHESTAVYTSVGVARTAVQV